MTNIGIEGKVAPVTVTGLDEEGAAGREAVIFKADVFKRDDVYAAIDHALAGNRQSAIHKGHRPVAVTPLEYKLI